MATFDEVPRLKCRGGEKVTATKSGEHREYK
jgi:hypothetical protein